MSYPDLDTSEADARPVELYYFSRGATPSEPAPEEWRFTSAQYDFDTEFLLYPFGGIYASRSIRRNEVAQSSERGRNTLQLTVPRDFEIVEEFRRVPVPGAIGLTLMQVHQRDFDYQFVQLWSGRVLSAQWDNASAQLSCEPTSASLERNGLRRLYSRTCTHALYDGLCRVVPQPVSMLVSDQAGTRLLLDGAALLPDEFAGGWVEAAADGGRKTMIVNHTDTEATLIHPVEFEHGEAVLLYRGCDKSVAVCEGRFDNLPNYGGFPFIPDKNPFDTGIF